jgi:virginiamycin B lyase
MMWATIVRRRGRLSVVTAAIVAVLGIAAWVATPARPRGQFVVEHAMLEHNDTPTAIAAAPDGTVWFTMDSAAAIGRIQDGRVERIATARKLVEPLGIGIASDGTVWFADAVSRSIARVSSSGELARFELDTPIVRLGRLAVAPDGAAWFAEPTGYSITSLKDGTFSRHILDSPRAVPFGVATAPDGTVWATLQSANQLLRIGPDGSMSAFDLPRPGAQPTDIAVGPDGAIWFVEFRANAIGRLKEGRVEEYQVRDHSGLAGLAVSADGDVWFAMLRSAALGRLRGGKIAVLKLPRGDARPFGVAIDRAGNVWYADLAGFVGQLPAREAQR